MLNCWRWMVLTSGPGSPEKWRSRTCVWGCPRCLELFKKRQTEVGDVSRCFSYVIVIVFITITIIIINIITIIIINVISYFRCFLQSPRLMEDQRLPTEHTPRIWKRKGSSWGAWFWHFGTWGDMPKKGLLKLPLLLFKHNINNIYVLFSMFFFRYFLNIRLIIICHSWRFQGKTRWTHSEQQGWLKWYPNTPPNKLWNIFTGFKQFRKASSWSKLSTQLPLISFLQSLVSSQRS